MYSRIRPTPKDPSFFERIAGYAFAVIILASILVGLILRVANAEERKIVFEDSASQYLYEQGVNFIHLGNTDTFTILRREVPDSNPPRFEYKPGFDTPQAVCDKLRENARIVSRVVFHNRGQMPPESITSLYCR